MGLCLYLALMKRTLGDNFTFAVLDDVLMSVDLIIEERCAGSHFGVPEHPVSY